MTSQRLKLCVLGLFLTGSLAQADILVLKTSSAFTNDFVTWGQLGADQTALTNPVNATSTGGASVTVTFANTNGLVAQVGNSWGPASGDFLDQDFLIWAYDNSVNANNGSGPVSFVFPLAGGAGAAIQADSPGQFAAKLELFNGVTSLGFVTETSDVAGDAIYIGAQDMSGANVTKAVFSLTAVGSNPNSESNNAGDFSLDSLGLQTSAPAPEPATFALFGGALLGLGWKVARRRISK